MSIISYIPSIIRVEDAQADVWKFNMNTLHDHSHTLFSYLDDAEKKRFKKLVDIYKQRNHMACRGLLRYVVSLYTKEEPKQIQFSYNSYGKPFVLSHPAYLFNTSHSGGWLYIIVSPNHEVGIDCEIINDKNINKLAGNILNPNDYAQFTKLPEQFKTKRLIQVWTQKEAFIKAIGKGLFYQNLKDINVDISGSVNTNISNYYDGDSWITKTLNIWDDHIISICYKKGEKIG